MSLVQTHEREGVGRWPLAIATAALALVLAPSWLLGFVPVRADATAYFWPLRERLGEALSAGVLPVYDLLNDCGTPLLINPQTGALYPPHLMYAVLSVPRAMAMLHAAHLLLLAAGVVALLRRLGYGWSAASAGALSVGLGGAALSVSAMQDKLYTLAWVPWALGWMVAAASPGAIKPRVRAVIAGAAAISVSVLAGGLDVVILGAALAAVVVPFAGGWRRGRGALEGVCVLALCYGVGAALSAVQWLPFWDWLQTTDWGGAAPGGVSRALLGEHLLGLVAPNAGYVPALDELHLPWRDGPVPFYLPGLYLGGAGLLLAGFGAVAGVRRPGIARVAVAGVVLFVVLALALGPIGEAESRLPVLSMVRYPHKWSIPAVLLVAVLVAEGVRDLMGAGRTGRGPLIVAGIALLIALVAGTVGPRLPDGGLVSGRDLVTSSAGALGAGGLALACLAVARWVDGVQRVRLVALAVAIMAADLAWHNAPLAPVADPDVALAPPPAAQFLADQPGEVRLFPYSYLAHGMGPPSQPGASRSDVLLESMVPGIPAAHGFALPLGWLVGHPVELQRAWVDMGELTAGQRLQRMRLAGVTHLLVNGPEHGAALSALSGVVRPGGGVAAGEACTVEVLAVVDPMPRVRLTPGPDPAADGRPVEVMQDENGTFRAVDVEVGRLVWLRPWDPYWRAWIDGRPAATEIVNGYQLSLPLPVPAAEVRLEYHVPALARGGVISGVTALLLLGAVVGLRVRVISRAG